MGETPYRDPAPPPPARFEMTNPWRLVFPLVVMTGIGFYVMRSPDEVEGSGVPVWALFIIPAVLFLLWLSRNRYVRIVVDDRVSVVSRMGERHFMTRADVTSTRLLTESELLVTVPALKPDRLPSLLPRPKDPVGVFRSGWYPCADGRLALVLGLGVRWLMLESDDRRMFLAPARFDEFLREVDQRIVRIDALQPADPTTPSE